MQNIGRFIMAYRISDLVIFILLLVRFRVGLFLLLLQSLILMTLEQLDSKDFYEETFGELGEASIIFVRKLGFIGALIAFI